MLIWVLEAVIGVVEGFKIQCPTFREQQRKFMTNRVQNKQQRIIDLRNFGM